MTSRCMVAMMEPFADIGVPAAGAPTVQILIASAFGLGTTAILLWLVNGHRSGRSQVLERAGARATRLFGLTPWAALGLFVASQGLIAGGFGVFWDISLHIGSGRDAGPLANPSHYPILWALYSLFAAGVLTIALHESSG